MNDIVFRKLAGRGDGNLKWIFDVNSNSVGLLSAGMKFGPV